MFVTLFLISWKFNSMRICCSRSVQSIRFQSIQFQAIHSNTLLFDAECTKFHSIDIRLKCIASNQHRWFIIKILYAENEKWTSIWHCHLQLYINKDVAFESIDLGYMRENNNNNKTYLVYIHAYAGIVQFTQSFLDDALTFTIHMNKVHYSSCIRKIFSTFAQRCWIKLICQFSHLMLTRSHCDSIFRKVASNGWFLGGISFHTQSMNRNCWATYLMDFDMQMNHFKRNFHIGNVIVWLQLASVGFSSVSENFMHTWDSL